LSDACAVDQQRDASTKQDWHNGDLDLVNHAGSEKTGEQMATAEQPDILARVRPHLRDCSASIVTDDRYVGMRVWLKCARKHVNMPADRP